MGLLSSKAGCGKTFLATYIVNKMKDDKPDYKMALTAPTHKAVRVLASSLVSRDVPVTTIHSFLGLTENIANDGTVTFKPRHDRKPINIDLLIIDECSMIGTELFNYINSPSILIKKVLFIGDREQIQPIGEEMAAPFQLESKMMVWQLKTPLRQAANSAIYQLADKVRGTVSAVRWANQVESNAEITIYSGIKQRAGLYKCLENLFRSSEFARNSDFAKVLCFTNKTAAAYNQIARTLMPEIDHTKPYSVGDVVVTRNPWFVDSEAEYPAITNNTELVIKRVEDHHYTLEKIKFEASFLLVNSDGGTQEIPVLKPESIDEFKKLRDKLAEEALDLKKKGKFKEASQAWAKFYGVDKVFAKLEHGFALTVHRSQGSTYQNAVVIESDLEMVRDLRERNRLKYTAFTRPSKQLVLVG